jgi:hypothetical protein
MPMPMSVWTIDIDAEAMISFTYAHPINLSSIKPLKLQGFVLRFIPKTQVEQRW